LGFALIIGICINYWVFALIIGYLHLIIGVGFGWWVLFVLSYWCWYWVISVGIELWVLFMNVGYLILINIWPTPIFM